MRSLTSLSAAVAEFVRDGDIVALEGTAQLVPFAATHELIRQNRKDLTVVRVAPDLVLDQLAGMGCARRVIFAWGGRPSSARLHRLRDALDHGWPRRVIAEQLRPTDLASAYEAGATGLPFGVLNGYGGPVAMPRTRLIRPMRCPFTGNEVAVVRAIRPDVAIIHAQEADRDGNVLLWGALGVQKAAVLASRRAIVTVEEIVDDLRAWPNPYRLPRAIVSAVCLVPGGAQPSAAQGYYERDRGFYQAWDAIARVRGAFRGWMERHVRSTTDFDEFRRVLVATEGGSGT